MSTKRLLSRCLISLPGILFMSLFSYSQNLEDISLKNGIKFHGNLNLQLEYYHTNQIDPRKKKFSWLINGNPSVDIGGIQIPFSFIVSNFENKFYQPFNQFGISPYYKWIKLHLGYRNLMYSPFTLAGHQMLGAGFDLTPGKFRLGFMYGRLRKSTSIDSSMNANPLFIRPAPTYKRLGYAAKVGYGTQKNYLDLIYFKAGDQENSLSAQLKDSIQPAENTSIGLSSKLTLVKNLSWKVDVGLSAYTINQNDAKDSSGTTKNNEWIRKLMSSFAKDRLSTHYYFSGETRLGYQLPKWGAELVYKRIDPGYQSMGAYFFQSDLQETTLVNQFRLDSGRLNINTHIGFQKDNLEKQKTSTSERFIGSVNISYVPSMRFGINFNYSNFGITNNPLAASPGNELFKQVNNSAMLMPFFNWMNEKTAKNLNLVFMFQSLSTPQSNIGTLPNLNTYSATAGYNHTWLKHSIQVNGTGNYILSKIPQGNIGSFGGSIGGMAPFLQNKLQVNTNISYLNNTFNKKPNGHTIRGTLGVSVPVGEHHHFQLLGNYLNNEAVNTTVIQSFNEFSIQFTYGLSF